MNPWLEVIGVISLVPLGALLGLFSARLKRPWWFIGYIIPLALILMIGLTRHFHIFAFMPPFSWVVAGRLEFVLLAIAVNAMFMTVLPKLPVKRQRYLVGIFAIVATLYHSTMPFLGPIISYNELKNLTTSAGGNYCMQQTDYTCGPAAAVTALRFLGEKAQEGELAILAHTSSYAGTPEDLLYEALKERYESKGFRFDYRLFDNMEQLRDAGITLAVIKFSFMVDHYVTVLEVLDDKLRIADPLKCEVFMPIEDFKKIWRYSGITVNRPGYPKPVFSKVPNAMKKQDPNSVAASFPAFDPYCKVN